MPIATNIRNYFADLGIEPTLDYNDIKKAYKDLIVKAHPDKGGSLERAQEIINAFDFLKDSGRLRQCYDLYSNHQQPTYTPSAHQFGAAPSPDASFEGRSDAVVRHGAKVTIVILVHINKKEEEAAGFDDNRDVLSPLLFTDATQFNYVGLANYLTKMSSKNIQQVGVDLREAEEIFNQHSWYKKGRRGAYGVTVEVYLHDLDLDRKSERDITGPNCVSARTEKYFWLKQGTVINPLDIKRIERADYYNPIPLKNGSSLFQLATPDMVGKRPQVTGGQTKQRDAEIGYLPDGSVEPGQPISHISLLQHHPEPVLQPTIDIDQDQYEATIARLRVACQAFSAHLVKSNQLIKNKLVTDLIATLDKNGSAGERLEAFKSRFNELSRSDLARSDDSVARKWVNAIGHILASIFTLGVYPIARAVYEQKKWGSARFWQSENKKRTRQIDNMVNGRSFIV